MVAYKTAAIVGTGTMGPGMGAVLERAGLKTFTVSLPVSDYRIPATEDLPEKMTCIIVENGDGPGPFGAKGCGEGVLAAIPAAIVNALADVGVSMTELPLTPERVWRRIRESESQKQEGKP